MILGWDLLCRAACALTLSMHVIYEWGHPEAYQESRCSGDTIAALLQPNVAWQILGNQILDRSPLPPAVLFIFFCYWYPAFQCWIRLRVAYIDTFVEPPYKSGQS